MTARTDGQTPGRASPAIKLALIVVLIVALVVPLLIVYALIIERQGRAQEVQREVGGLWGPEQRLLGPFLIVPYTIRVEIVQGDKRIEQMQERRAVFTPETLQIAGTADARLLRRSIFEVPVYAARLKLAGRFGTPRITDVAPDAVAVRWRDAFVALGLSGVSGLKDGADLRIEGGAALAFSPSIGLATSTQPGIHARLEPLGETLFAGPDAPPRPFTFAIDLAFNGSVSLLAAPVARVTSLSLQSSWPHPSFTGAFLPDTREISGQGFQATWRIPHLARSVPEAWNLGDSGLERLLPYSFGVRLIEPVDFYSLVDRAAKYGILFIALAFMAVFCVELMSPQRVHPVQYLFTGVALVFFYVLLLSLAEHLGFAGAYLLAASATGLMLAVYIGAALGSLKRGLMMLAVFAATYGALFLILQLEDYALLAGAGIGFVALALVMFLTLRIDWSGLDFAPQTAARP